MGRSEMIDVTSIRPFEFWGKSGDWLAPIRRDLPTYLERQRCSPVIDARLPQLALRILVPLHIPRMTVALAIWRAASTSRPEIERAVADGGQLGPWSVDGSIE
jgi:hypothetical protein